MLKRIVNRSEEVVGDRLHAVCRQYDARVYAKVRLADVCKIEHSGLSKDEYGFALRSHFDFVVTDADHGPLFVVEFDGPLHETPEQAARDSMKDAICARFSLPLLRCRSAHIEQRHDGWDLLSWLVDVWFLREAAERMQEEGGLPPDFDFDPSSIVTSPGHSRRFPYWLGLDSQLKIERLQQAGRIIDRIPRALYLGVDSKNVLHGFAMLRIDAQVGVRSKVAMRSQAFRADLTDALRGVLMNQLFAELQLALSEADRASSLNDIDAELKRLMAATVMLSCMGHGGA